MNLVRVFLVEDDPIFAELLKYHLSEETDYEIELFSTGKELMSNLYKGPDIICLDYSLPDTTGDVILAELRERIPGTPVILVTALTEVSAVIGLFKLGCYDYIVKDDETIERLKISLKNAREKNSLKTEILHLREELTNKFDIQTGLVGKSKGLGRVQVLVKKAIDSLIPVSLTGESGVGKHTVARAIHYNSKRKNEAYVTCNLSAIPHELLEIELFGEESNQNDNSRIKKGKFELAHGGTLHIEEIAKASSYLQSLLLKVLETNEVTRVGGQEPISLDFRLIVSSNENMLDGVKRGVIREDLYYKIMGLPIHVPSLRDREEDILLLAQYFLDEYTKKNGLNKKSIVVAARTRLLKYSYPGNVRELRSVMELAVVMSEGDVIQREDIVFADVEEHIPLLQEEKTLKEYIREIVSFFLKKYDNNVIVVANKLGMGKSTIYQMLKEESITSN